MLSQSSRNDLFYLMSNNQMNQMRTNSTKGRLTCPRLSCYVMFHVFDAAAQHFILLYSKLQKEILQVFMSAVVCQKTDGMMGQGGASSTAGGHIVALMTRLSGRRDSIYSN